MKRLTGFISRVRGLVTKEYLVYTGLFFAAMMGLYVYMIYAGMAQTPGFTYSEF